MPSTAILIFARTHAFESKCKPLTVNDDQLYLNLNKRVILLANRTGLPYFISDETNQVGDSFGEKLTNAVSGVFDSGFEQVMILGNDCPQLSLQCLKKARNLLRDNQLVLGPDFRGGAYLIGIDKSIFDENAMRVLRWQTKYLFGELQSLHSAHILSPLYDLNDLASVRQIIKVLPAMSAIRNLLFFLIRQLSQFYCDTHRFINSDEFHKFSLRGPPVKSGATEYV